MKKRIKNKKAKQSGNRTGLQICDEVFYNKLEVNAFGHRVGDISFLSDRKINCIQPEITPMTPEQAEEMRKALKIEFDKSGKESASYVSECGWRFEFKKEKT